MKAVHKWNYRPYASPRHLERQKNPFICRIVPGEKRFGFEWFDNSANGPHMVKYRKYQSMQTETVLTIDEQYVEITGLEDEQDYEFAVCRADGSAQSDMRLVRTGYVPGVVINYIHPLDETYLFSGKFLSSPSIIRLPSGDLLASMDIFYHGGNMTLLYKSQDCGTTWHYVADLFPAFWGKLFLHRDTLYFLCADKNYGNLTIGKSTDEGESWSAPVKLINCFSSFPLSGVHKSAVPVVNQGPALVCN